MQLEQGMYFDVNLGRGDAANPIKVTLASGDSYLTSHTLTTGKLLAKIRNTHGSLSLFWGASNVATSGANKGTEIKPGYEDDFVSTPGSVVYIKSTSVCTLEIREA